MNIKNRTIFTRDNLEVMRGMKNDCIDLIYLDPPFNSNADYAAPIGSEAAGAEFKDTWGLSDIDLAWYGEIAEKYPGLYELLTTTRTIHGNSMMSYLIYMAIRVMEMKRVLKPAGAIYLHCDQSASHYLKLMMDCIFGKNKYYSEITWQRTFAHNDKLFGTITDSIFCYGNAAVNPASVILPLDPAYVKKNYRREDDFGSYQSITLTGPGTTDGESGQPWKGHHPTHIGRHWATPRTGAYADYINEHFIPGYSDIEGVHARLDALDDAGLIIWSEKRTPRLKRYLMPEQGTYPGNLWTDIPPVSSQANSRTGYRTQKPTELVQRIIRASSNPEDMVMDPFCGCATACVAAEIEGRQWIGIDVGSKAYDLVKKRLAREVNVGDEVRTGEQSPILERYEVIHRTDIPSDREGKKSKNIRHIRYGEQEGKCNGCLEHFPFRNMTEDHIVPTSKGGTDVDHNIQLLCGACNSKKGDRMTHDELIAALIEEGVRK